MPSPSGPRTARGQVREAVVRTSRELIAESGGPASLSVAEVARRLGVSTAAPYRHFADRADLVGAVLAEVAGELADAVVAAAASAEDPADAFPLAVAAYARHTSGTRVGFADLTGTAARDLPGEALRDATRRLVDALSRAALARGARDPAAAARAVDETLAAAGGLVEAYRAGALAPGVDVDAVAARAADLARALVPRRRRRAAPDPVEPEPGEPTGDPTGDPDAEASGDQTALF